MRKMGWFLAAFGLMVLSACVTINVYFPAAEAQEAAREFVEKVIGDEMPGGQPPAPVPQQDGGGMALLSFFISSAHAQIPDITIRTPAIQAIQARMADRFQSQLAPHFDKGALGFGRDGLVVVRDAGSLGLKDRAAVNQAVADDNRDRAAVYREIAVANGHPEWEQQIRETFARQWVSSARAGWWYQDAGGAWKQK
ncbi:YdbL family protein [Denitratimonas tolerans]|uniref:YdbL family protein n=1 Tax=Denitratimonas tolerans TaxID=1338420 RepID=A0AAW9R4B0_9GAMM